MSKTTKKISYKEAYDELLSINEDLENNEIGIDDLTKKLKRAGELIKICRNQIKLTEEETKNILEQFD
ncbi:MAG: exodeoxyribonuclease VII small subunit [Bacteroidales bacterium]|jgi:exodeoxyribonuclease VII small subunit|nr:exodeoxyribonuclease VII small subunit [Bacteroidales bacterium]